MTNIKYCITFRKRIAIYLDAKSATQGSMLPNKSHNALGGGLKNNDSAPHTF